MLSQTTVVSSSQSPIQRLTDRAFLCVQGYGKRGHSQPDTNIRYAVVTRLKDRINRIGDRAFIVNHGIDDTKDGMVKGRPMHQVPAR